MSKFSLSDFKFGDIITLRNGDRYVYADGYMYGESDSYYADSDRLNDYYNYDLTRSTDINEYDIIQVERCGEILFKREIEIKEMTLQEVCKALGYEVKIIKED